MANDADPAGTDVGRRIAEQRDRAGLTVAEAAGRAGMSPAYLAYLESSTSPNPSQATLTRIAGALKIPPGSLSGAGLNLPPGQRDAAHSPVLATLTAKECRAHIASGGVGRFLFVEPGRGPVAIPVNYRMDGGDIVFRTGSQTSIADAVAQQQVSFDVDHLDDTLAEGWSVLLTGTARIITDPAEREHAAALGIQPWAGGERDVYVRLTSSQITGRGIRVTG
jgi:transcriptional regulator with XRE-family HTH domain